MRRENSVPRHLSEPGFGKGPSSPISIACQNFSTGIASASFFSRLSYTVRKERLVVLCRMRSWSDAIGVRFKLCSEYFVLRLSLTLFISVFDIELIGGSVLVIEFLCLSGKAKAERPITDYGKWLLSRKKLRYWVFRCRTSLAFCPVMRGEARSIVY